MPAITKTNLAHLFTLTLLLFAAFIAGGFLIQKALAAWSEPASAPPSNQPEPPVNIGLAPQIKSGGLGVASLTVDGGAALGIVSGNVGIGVTSPIGKLHVVDNEIYGNLLDDDGDLMTDETDGLMVFTTQGNVGIGTASPGGKLEVNYASGQRGLESIGPSGNSNFPWSDGSVYISGANIIFRDSGNSERMRMTGTGKVGIGTTGPGGIVDVEYSESTTYNPTTDLGGLSNGLRIHNTNTTDNTASMLIFDHTRTSGATQSSAYIGALHPDHAGGQGHLVFGTKGAGGTNVERVRIQSTGNVGIGTTGPVDRLQLHTTGTSLAMQVGTAATGASGGDGMLFGYDDASTRGGMVWNREAAGIAFATSNTQRMTIDSSGNVGIGTAGPNLAGRTRALTISAGITGDAEASLELQGSSAATADQGVGNLYGFSQGNQVGLIQFRRGSANDEGYIIFGTKQTGVALGERMRITATGNVGIGTTSPATTLHVHKAEGNNVYFTTDSGASGNEVGLWFSNDGGGSRWAGIGMRTTDDALRFTGGNSSLADGNTHMVISNTGNVGIGTTGPTQKLDVAGTITATSFSGGNVTSGTDPGHTHTSVSITEADPTVTVSVKDGVAWGELSGIPAGFADGDDAYPWFCCGDTGGSNITVSPGRIKLNYHWWDDGQLGGPNAIEVWDSAGNLQPGTNMRFKVEGSNGGVYSDYGMSTPADYAEYLYSDDATLQPGELVCLAGAAKVKRCYKDDLLIGVVSTKPGVVGVYAEDVTETAEAYEQDPHWVKVGLMGQVPTRVSVSQGTIKAGDQLTIQDHGVTVKGKSPRTLLILALEDAEEDGLIRALIK